MAETSSNLIVIDCMSLPEISLLSIKVVKAKETYRYVEISDSDIISVHCLLHRPPCYLEVCV